MSISLTVYWQQFVDRLISSGRYNNQSEVIRAGLRALEERDLGREVREFEQVFADGRTGEPDEKVLARMVSRQRSFVTYDQDLLELEKPFGVEIIHPAELRRRLAG